MKLNDGAVKIFLSAKGTMNDVSQEIKNFLNYVDSGIVSGTFVKELDEAVRVVKSNGKARLDFMTYQMALLESKMDGREEGIESVARNMIIKGRPLEEIREFTELSLEKIKELAQKVKVPANRQ